MNRARKAAKLALGGGEGVPCLWVGDLDRAVSFYRDRAGFRETELLGGQRPHAALASGHGATVLLRAAGDEERESRRRRSGNSDWDALFFVGDLDRVARELRDGGVRIEVGIGVSAVAYRTLEIRDEWGNALAFAEAAGGWRPATRELAERVIPARLRTSLRDRKFARQERPEHARFARFHAELPDRRDPVYMFFTKGLLHWVAASAKHIPPEVNLVFFGSGLPAEEQRWLSEHLGRPVFNSQLEIDDNTAWEILFAANTTNFGYVDIDCFVLDPRVFADLAAIGDDVAVNAAWTYPAAPGVPVACTHLVFLNAGIIAKLRDSGRYLSPANYAWDGGMVPLLHHRTYCRVPTPEQRRLLLEVLPADERGLPKAPGEAPFFDTLIGYQIAAAAAGYRTRAVRPLAHRTQAMFAEAAAAGKHVWQQDLSDELVHIGGISYYGRYFHAAEFRKLYLAAEYSVLRASVDRLPPGYRERRSTIERQLREAGLDPLLAREFIREHLVADRGIGAEAADRILGGPE
ncbi:VOC family protein [Amycolatopsis rubida]|uniref:VOC domain-containing protein n=1 Tax=Amycolatopsis rubida TaxID=112413 RepID=A0A1I6AJB0_9PSEU|nr:VOC family protein [Amycolatopsis rubida]SFQ68762.1 hypothetical protein SAMN05421854_11977 [Amycolatopsis rubida]